MFKVSGQVNQLLHQISVKDTQSIRLQSVINEKQEQVRGLEELTTLQREQLEVQHREIADLSNAVKSLRIQHQEDQPQGSEQKEVTALNAATYREKASGFPLPKYNTYCIGIPFTDQSCVCIVRRIYNALK